jgi:hypothetical protein
VSEKFPDATTPTERSRAAASIVRRQPRRPDHDRDARLDRGERVRLHRRRRGVVDEDVDAVERVGDRAVDRDAERGVAERLPEVAPGRRPGDRRAEGQVGSVEHSAHQGSARPSRGARDAHRNALRLRHDQALPASFVQPTPDHACPGRHTARRAAIE